MVALRGPSAEILAKSLDDTDFARFGDLEPKESLCFQWSIVWLYKFLQNYFWAKRGKSMPCGSKKFGLIVS
jgi:hypothetical protein